MSHVSSRESEYALIAAHNPFDSTLDYFGIPDCVHTDGLVVFDEAALQTNYQRYQLWLLTAIARLVTPPILAHFTLSHATALRQLWAVADWATAQAATKLAQIQKLTEDEVIVLHEWSGRWRPTNARDHAACMVSEMVADGHDLDSFLYSRLQAELAAGRFASAEVDVVALVSEARDRCRLALKDNVRAVKQWMVLDHKHAILARVFHYLNNVTGWAELALSRFGQVGGPRTKEAELTLDEVEMLVRGLRMGSFSQSSLVDSLSTLERGLEELRRAEVASASSECILSRAGFIGADAIHVPGELDFDLEQYLVGLEVDGEVGSADDATGVRELLAGGARVC